MSLTLVRSTSDHLTHFLTELNSIYLVGLMILIFTSLPTSLAHNAGLPGLIVTMVIVGVAVGGVKATIGPFMGIDPEKRPIYAAADRFA